MTIAYHELGKERLNIIKNSTSWDDIKKLWPPAAHDYPFAWGDCWKATMTYRVPDFAAEFCFYVDVLGFELFAHWDDHAMLCSPDKEYILTVGQTPNPNDFTPSSVQLDLMLSNLVEVTERLKKRDVMLLTEMEVEGPPSSPMRSTTFATPNGVLVKLWGMVPIAEQ